MCTVMSSLLHHNLELKWSPPPSGIEASDLTSLLERFEETQSMQTLSLPRHVKTNCKAC